MAKKPAKKRPGGWAAFTEGGSVPIWLTAARAVLVLAFCATIPGLLAVEHGNRIFWTVMIASLPLFWVVGGYHIWRRICPLAVVGQVGRLVGRGGGRKAGDWLAANYFLLQLGLMFVALSLRLIATNGSPVALAGFLGVVALAALVIGFVFTGKTWCNYVCPVGMVEKIYTEPSRLHGELTSQCAPCSACKKHCPDIDLEQGYWKEMAERPRRMAYFAWPGLVLGFYTYFYLRSGSWDDYFSGAWTYDTEQPAHWLSAGFWFAPEVPVVVAAPLTLALFAGASLLLFHLGERIARALTPAAEDRDIKLRHRVLVLAGFVAINIFYFFGGQPTIRRLPNWAVVGWTVLVVFATSAIFFRRWRRSETEFVREKFAKGILKRWQWGDQPASTNLGDVYLLHTERTKEREQRLAAYKDTLRELVADGLVTKAELAILGNMRAQLGITEKDHEKIVGELSDEERQLFDPAYVGSAELRLQREQYDRELERAVLNAARAGRMVDPDVLAGIRAQYGVGEAEQDQAMASLLAEDGPVMALYREELAAIDALAAAAAACAAPTSGDPSASLDLVRHLAGWRAGQHLERALAVLAAFGGSRGVAPLRNDLAAADPRRRASALESLVAIGGERGAPLAAGLGRLWSPPQAPPTEADPFLALAADTSPYLRAGIALVLSRFDTAAARERLIALTDDPLPLVREAAYRALMARGSLGRELMVKAMKDGAESVRKVATRDAGDAGASGTDYATLDASARMDTLIAIEKMMLLRNVPMFRDLDPDDLEELTRIAGEQHFATGGSLCREGEPGSDVFLIISGRVRVYTGEGSGERTLDHSGPGACIGEMAALDQAPRSASVAAVEPTRALVLPGPEFKALMLERPEIGQRILEQIVGRMRRLIAERNREVRANTGS